MDYILGLNRLRSRISERNEKVFLILEARLLENLEEEKLYGGNEKNKSERAKIVYELNNFSIEIIAVSFNDLCRGEKELNGFGGESQSPRTGSKLSDKAKKIFISYSHKDVKILRELEKHLASLKREGLVSTWTDREITAGSEWEPEIMRNLIEAQIILFLVSADFINSNYCYDIEFKKSIELHEQGSATIIPVIVRPTDWHKTPLGKYQSLPPFGKPVTGSDWKSKDLAYLEIVKGIRMVLEGK